MIATSHDSQYFHRTLTHNSPFLRVHDFPSTQTASLAWTACPARQGPRVFERSLK
jgi:hypothetical protein